MTRRPAEFVIEKDTSSSAFEITLAQQTRIAIDRWNLDFSSEGIRSKAANSAYFLKIELFAFQLLKAW